MSRSPWYIAVFAVAAALAVAPDSVSAQYGIMSVRALATTPGGALPAPLQRPGDEGESALGLMGSRWSRDARAANHAIGATYAWSRRRGDQLSAIAGAFLPGCDGCSAVPMVGVRHVAMGERRLGESVGAPTLVFNLQSTIGYGREPESNNMAAVLSPMLGVAVTGPWASSVEAYGSLGAGLGLVRASGPLETGGRMMAGGGIGWRMARGDVVHVSISNIRGTQGIQALNLGYQRSR